MSKRDVDVLMNFSSANLQIALSMAGISTALLTFMWVFVGSPVYPMLFWLTIMLVLGGIFCFTFSFVYLQLGAAICLKEPGESTLETAHDCVNKGVGYLRLGTLSLLFSILFIVLQIALHTMPSFRSDNSLELVLIFSTCVMAVALPVAFLIRAFLASINI